MEPNNPYLPPDARRPSRARTVITRSGAIVRGKFPSRKNQCMIHHEGLLELEACYLFEMSPAIAAYHEQPPKIWYADDERLRKYFPDFELTLKTGDTVLVEIKHSAILARDEIRHKYQQIAAHLQRTDQAYCILTEATIRQEPRLSSLRYAYAQLTTRSPTPTYLKSLASSLSDMTNPSVGEINTRLNSHGISAFDLLAGGHLACDLTQPVRESTRVSINRESNYEWIRISKELPF